MTPHTLEEQKALLTAEAEGRAVYRLSSDEAGRKHEKAAGYWDFARDRYEVERPLMEEWVVLSSNGVDYGTYGVVERAQLRRDNCDAEYASCAPFRVVHMREVR